VRSELREGLCGGGGSESRDHLRDVKDTSSRVKAAKKCRVKGFTVDYRLFVSVPFAPSTPHPSSRVYSLMASKSYTPRVRNEFEDGVESAPPVCEVNSIPLRGRPRMRDELTDESRAGTPRVRYEILRTIVRHI